MMKLSDAAVLGSCTTEMAGHDWDNCFLGAAANAIGLPRISTTIIDGIHTVDVQARIDAILEYWPWLNEHEGRRLTDITSMYDSGRYTFEEMVEYVRSVEPPCACAVRDCCCDRSAYLFGQFPESDVEQANAMSRR